MAKKTKGTMRSGPAMSKAVQALELQNNQLRETKALLKSAIELKNAQLQNSMMGLANPLTTQDNISSLTPLFNSNLYAPLTLQYTLLTYLYKTHGVLQTMIDEPVYDAFRDGIDLTSDEIGSPDMGDLEDFIEEKGILDSVKNAGIWARLYGGAGLIVNVGQDWEQPFNEKDIAQGMLELYDADRWEFAGASRSAKEFLFYGKKLDASRVITMGGKRAPRLIRAQLSGWGMSEMERTAEDFNMWLRGRNVLYEILDEAKVDVYGIKDYANTLATPSGESVIRNRIQMTNQIKNFHNALILDKEDEYHVIANSFAGLAEVMKENRIGLASALRMPMTKIFGMGATGLNASSEDDIENYNAMITSQVREPMRPLLRKVLRLCQLAVFGEVYDIKFSFKPLRMLGAAEEEGVKKSKQDRYLSLYNARLLNSKEMGELMHKENLVPIVTEAQEGKLPPNTTTVEGEDDIFKKGDVMPDAQATPAGDQIGDRPGEAGGEKDGTKVGGGEGGGSGSAVGTGREAAPGETEVSSGAGSGHRDGDNLDEEQRTGDHAVGNADSGDSIDGKPAGHPELS